MLFKPFLLSIFTVLSTYTDEPVAGVIFPRNPNYEAEVINGILVPPDPGEENNKTLLGIDANENGIRDDIDRFIAKTFSNSPEKRKAAEFLGRINYLKFSRSIPKNRSQAELLVNLRFKNQECYLKEFDSQGRDFRVDLPNLIDLLYLNSELRYSFDREITRLSNGMALVFETDPGKMCLEGMK